MRKGAALESKGAYEEINRKTKERHDGKNRKTQAGQNRPEVAFEKSVNGNESKRDNRKNLNSSSKQ